MNYSEKVRTLAKRELDHEYFLEEVKECKEKLRSKRSQSLLHKLIPFKIVRR